MKPWGRTLKDFYVQGTQDLSSAEEDLRQAACRGERCEFLGWQGHACPPKTAARTISAAFLRFLLLGGDDDAPVHERGIRLANAYIAGWINLDECDVKVSLSLENCVLEKGLCTTDASIKSLALTGCQVGAIPEDEVRLSKRRRMALYADRMSVAGSLYIKNATRLDGVASLTRVNVDGDVNLDEIVCGETPGRSIDLSAARIGGSLYMRHVTVISNNMDETDGPAVWCLGMSVKGGFFFQNSRVTGMSLIGAQIGTFVDDLASWQTGEGHHRFNGLVYDRFADESRPVDRWKWLLYQRREDCGPVSNANGSGLRRQPWQQVARALEMGGDFEGARRIRIKLEKHMVKQGGWLRAFWAVPYGWVCGFGFAPGRLLALTVVIWVIGAAVVDRAASVGMFSANEKEVISSYAYKTCFSDKEFDKDNFLSGYCRNLTDPDSPPLYPLLYSADNLIPIIDLGQKKIWRVNAQARWAWGYLLIEYIFGFVAASALVGALGSFVVRKVG